MQYLVKYIARSGFAARRKAAELVKSGAVKVNGRVVTDPAFLVDDDALVMCQQQRLTLPAGNVYIMLNKPVGYTTSHADSHAEHLAIELIDCPEAGRLNPAGRLDRESEGLLIFSNDGDFIQQLSHPSYEIHKRYLVVTSRELDARTRARLCRGITDDGERLHAHQIEVLPERNNYIFELNEGKKREIRRMVRSAGAQTLQLRRLSVGEVELGDLPIGQWRHLTAGEVDSLRKK